MRNSHLSRSEPRRLLTLALGAALLLVGAQASAQTYTLDADFNTGVLNGVNLSIPNQLQLDAISPARPYIFIAQPNEGILLKINTQTGKELARYHTTLVSDCPGCPGVLNASQWSPSRTAVDLDGNVWVANRSFGVQGSVTKIGSPELGTCIDRNMNGMIDTSHDTAATPGLIDVSDPNEFYGQNDECIIESVPVGTPNAVLRALAIDENSIPWVGGFNTQMAYKIDPLTKTVSQTINVGVSTYGFAYHCGFLYAASLSGPNIARIDTNMGTVVLKACGNNYGIAVDKNGVAWLGNTGGGIVKADFTVMGPAVNLDAMGNGHTGIAIDGNGSIFAGAYGSGKVDKYDSNGVLLGSATTGDMPYGVAIAHDGAVWSPSMNNDKVFRVVANGAGVAPGAVTSFTTARPGAVNIQNYSYSDMTGFQARNFATRVGTWTVVDDSGVPGTGWGSLSWNNEPAGSEPPGTSITVEVRASDTIPGLSVLPFVQVFNKADLCRQKIRGRYLEVRVTLKAFFVNCKPSPSPILSDLVIRRCECMEVKEVKTECDPQGNPDTWVSHISVTNLGAVDAYTLLLPTMGTSPSSIALSPPLAPGDTRVIDVVITGATPGKKFCFMVGLLDKKGNTCCGQEICIVPPECEKCLGFREDGTVVKCGLNGSYDLFFDITNLSAATLEHVYLSAPPPVMLSPNHVQIAPLPPGGSVSMGPINITGATPPGPLCIDVSVHDAKLLLCCTRHLCFELPPCGKIVQQPGQIANTRVNGDSGAMTCHLRGVGSSSRGSFGLMLGSLALVGLLLGRRRARRS